MATVDWISLAVVLLSMLVGAWRGLVYEVLSVLGWILSFYVAQWLAPHVATWLPLGSTLEPARYGAAFALVFVATVFAAGLVAFLVKKVVVAIGLRPVDRTLGAAFGLVRALILLLAATVVIDMTGFKDSHWWRESRGAAVLTATLKDLKPMLPEQFAKYLVSTFISPATYEAFCNSHDFVAHTRNNTLLLCFTPYPASAERFS